jgi:uncharacterized membrane protein YfcA
VESLLATPMLIIFIAVALFLGGAVKGMVGVGLPLVVVSMLSSLLDPRLAVALVSMSVVVSNIWQSVRSGILFSAMRRFWPLILAFALSTWLGARILVSMDPSLMLGLLGTMVVLFSLLGLLQPDFRLSAKQERFAGPSVGIVAGVLNGVSTVNGPPLAIYLVSLGLAKEAFIGSYGLIALCGSFPLLISYVSVGLLGPTELAASTIAVAPAIAGLAVGERLRFLINPDLFRRILLLVLIVLGLNLIRRGLM